MTDRAARFAAAYALLRAGADLGDHWIQSDHCARTKGATDHAPVLDDDTGHTAGSREGRRACAWHCLTYTTTQAITLTAGTRLLGIRLHPAALTGALALSAVTHYIADRRVPNGALERLADSVGKGKFHKLAAGGISGAYLLDSAWHHGWETAAALIAANGTR